MKVEPAPEMSAAKAVASEGRGDGDRGDAAQNCVFHVMSLSREIGAVPPQARPDAHAPGRGSPMGRSLSFYVSWTTRL